MLSQLPALQVVIPLIAAPLCVILRNKEISCLISQAVSIISFLISLILLQQVLDQNVISYALGGWLAPIGIEYRLDILNTFILVIVSGISSIVTIYSKKSIEH